jgi:hypothetical protein
VEDPDEFRPDSADEPIVEPMTGPVESPVLTLEDFKAGYVPNNDDYHDFFGPINDLAQNALELIDAAWRADQLVENGRDVQPAAVGGVRYTFFVAGCVWMMKYMEAASSSAMHPSDFADVLELTIDGPEEPPE